MCARFRLQGWMAALAAGAWTMALVTPLLAATPAPTAAPAPTRPVTAASAAATSPIEQARKLYDAAKFQEAIDGLRSALAAGEVTGNSVIEARALMARCLVKTGNRLDAKQAFATVLRMDPAYRPDAVVVPPDEMDVFRLALAAVTTEQIEAGKRVPASIGFFYGTGSGDNRSLGEIQHFLGGSDKLDTKPEFGGSVRFPLRPRWSLDLELARFRATGEDSTQAPNTIDFEASAIPMVASVYWAALTGPHHRVNLFVGGGPLLTATNSIDLPFFTFRIKIADQKTGMYMHGGAEGEWLVHPKLAVSGRALYRSATANKLYHDSTLELYGTKAIKDRKVDFSGFGAYVGLRAYIGY